MANTKITTNVIADDAITTAKIADDAVGNDQLASGLTLGGNTAATLSTAAQPNITSLGTLTALQVDNININGNTISNTDTNGNIVITANGTGNVNVNTDVLAIQGTEGEYATLALQADEADDAGDGWKLTHNANNNTLSIKNDISGSEVDHMTLTPHATVASSIVSIPGKVGIQETSPDYNLHISNASQVGLRIDGSGSGYVQGSILLSSATSGSNAYRGHGIFYWNNESETEWFLGAPYTDSDRFVINRKASQSTADFSSSYIHASHGQNFLTVENDGKVGINDAYPPRRLSITGEDGAYSGQTSGNSRTHLLLENNGSNYIEFLNAESNSAAIFWSNNDGQNQGAIEYKDSHMYLQAHGQANQLVLDSQYGYIHCTGSNDVRLTLSTEGTAGTNSANWVRGNSAGLSFNAKASGNFHWEVNGTEKMRLKSNGQFILGRTTDDVDTIGAMMDSNGIVYSSINETTFNTFLYRAAQSANAYRFYVNGSGQVSSTFTSISSLSDARLKENVRDYTTGLDDILKLQPRVFDWKENEGKNIKNDVGFIAQEFEEVFPDWISNFLHDDLDDAKTVAASELIFPMVNAIKELKAEIDALKEKLNG